MSTPTVLTYEDAGFTERARRCVQAGEPFEIHVTGLAARLVAPLLPAPGVALTVVTAGAMVAIASLGALVIIVTYAISQGYDVHAEGRPDGSVSFKGRRPT